MKSKLYITTSIPYVNAEPHVGFALELVQADAAARYARLCGRTVRFQTGTDENAFKNVVAAKQAAVTVQELVDRNSARFKDLLGALNVSADDFIRTTDERHRRGVREFWAKLAPQDLDAREYIGLYCTGCEDFYLPRDLVDGKCPEHGTAPAQVAERNHFFRLARYQSWLEEQLVTERLAVIPPSRRREVLSFVTQGLCDFSISRSAGRTGGWGIQVPGDESQTVYVWVDALINYLSGLNFGTDDSWRGWWGEDVEKVHVIGKNVWKFHAVYWPALLRSAGLPLPDKIVVHGFVTADGRKIGKSLGNAVDPFAVIAKYGADAVRYYLLRAIPPFGDGDFSTRRLDELYRAELANGIGNLISRLASLCARIGYSSLPPAGEPAPPEGFAEAAEAFEFDKALSALLQIAADLNQRIEQQRPWELSSTDRDRLAGLLKDWLQRVWTLAYWLQPFLPAAARGIAERLFAGPVRPASPLFPKM
jgi:methionyl-tRNA synthetase